ncbi:hypothetical protein GCK72_013031 [Caenorhabditis remanei]|uniref:EMI domain-containing protein n=1 Tax=Caenorhabditis remanei TaxID=31234 RepID=A0A6A5GMJ4_CAERE|nr:hypothetical protein GCK72_013031 [Caenorhabditis remanei]KAF1756578.1 hypothetical protein GCK72_013031 [Caenorhabditis remanei]
MLSHLNPPDVTSLTTSFSWSMHPSWTAFCNGMTSSAVDFFYRQGEGLFGTTAPKYLKNIKGEEQTIYFHTYKKVNRTRRHTIAECCPGWVHRPGEAGCQRGDIWGNQMREHDYVNRVK